MPVPNKYVYAPILRMCISDHIIGETLKMKKLAKCFSEHIILKIQVRHTENYLVKRFKIMIPRIYKLFVPVPHPEQVSFRPETTLKATISLYWFTKVIFLCLASMCLDIGLNGACAPQTCPKCF